MMNTKINLRSSLVTLIILSAAMIRILITSGHTPFSNFTPVGSMALFGGKYFSEKWKAYLFPLLTLWISDLFLNYFIYYHEWRWFYDGFYWTYGSFALTVFLASKVKKVNIKNILLVCLYATLIHWIITNFGTWMSGKLYPQTLEGLISCYTMAIPYAGYTLFGNLVFSLITFGIFELMQKKYPSLKLTEQKY
jgi:hypothetical protein